MAAAAYRARCELRDDRTGEVQDYRRKGGLQHSEIMLPNGAADFLGDRQKLWNHAEAMEQRKDAQLSREINAALPHEISDAERLTLVRDFARSQFVNLGMVVDFAIHHPVPGAKGDQRNIHVHMMLTLRRATPTGLDRVKTRAWNSDAMLKDWREAWGIAQNRALERGGHRARVDHRSLDAQRDSAKASGDFTSAALLDRAPEIHVGPRATAAGQAGRAPVSQNRTSRPRQQPRKAPQEPRGLVKRVVRYRDIDKGPRRDWNSELVDNNRRRVRELGERRERQLVQFRRHEARTRRLVREIDRDLAAAAKGQGRGFWGRKGNPAALLQARRIRALGRAQLAGLLVADLEKTLARVLSVQRQQQERHRSLSRNWAEEIGRTHGGGRTRPPLF